MYLVAERLFRDPPMSSKVQARPRRGWTQDNHIVRFEKIGYLPTKLLLTRPDDVDRAEKTLQNHGAKWHDSCRLKYNIQLHRAEKRKTPRE